MEELPPIVLTVLGYGEQAWDIGKGWLLSPAAWSQFGLLVGTFLVTRRLKPALVSLISPAPGADSYIASIRRFALIFLPLLLPLLAYAFTAMGEKITRQLFGSGAVIAFGKRLFLFLAARALVRDMVTDPFLKLLGKYVLIPAMALYTLGILDPVTVRLTETVVGVGSIQFSAMTLLRGVIAGSLLFWLGLWSNSPTAAIIGQRQEMRPSIRQLLIKTVEFVIFATAFLLLMNIMGVNLTSLAVLGGAIGVGLGFGLQKIASNFISGVILLVEGQATVGDYVELDGGEAGRIVRMTARATVLETFDGRWVMGANEDFITIRVTNYSDAGSANRLSVAFSVSIDNDINRVPDVIIAAVSTHPGVLQLPEPPDVELPGFGDSGIDFAVEFRVNGLDDRPNKYSSKVRFLIWNALKDAGIESPYPHRVVGIKGAVPA